MCAEGLSGLLLKAVESKTLCGIKVVPSAPSISHLLFANNNIIFSQANAEGVDVIKKSLRVYEHSSCQLVSLDKTTVSFSKKVFESKKIWQDYVHDKCLGLATIVDRSKKVITKGVHEKVWKRLEG